jgi:hypothetical protein
VYEPVVPWSPSRETGGCAFANGPFDANSGSAPNNDHGASLLRLSSSLTVPQYFTPRDQIFR